MMENQLEKNMKNQMGTGVINHCLIREFKSSPDQPEALYLNWGLFFNASN